MIFIYAIIFLFGYLLTDFLFNKEKVFSEKNFAVIFTLLMFSFMVYVIDLSK